MRAACRRADNRARALVRWRKTPVTPTQRHGNLRPPVSVHDGVGSTPSRVTDPEHDAPRQHRGTAHPHHRAARGTAQSRPAQRSAQAHEFTHPRHRRVRRVRRPFPASAGSSTAGTGGPSLVAVAHGSRDPRALHTVTALLDRVRELRPGLDVRLGHIELNEPLLARHPRRAGRPARPSSYPLLLGRGYHVKRDIPDGRRRRVTAAHPRRRRRSARTRCSSRPCTPGSPRPAGARADTARRGTAVVLAAAGSRDPDVGRRHPPHRRDCSASASAASRSSRPTPPPPRPPSRGRPRALAARGRHRIAVASYFTAPGRFATAVRGRGPLDRRRPARRPPRPRPARPAPLRRGTAPRRTRPTPASNCVTA